MNQPIMVFDPEDGEAQPLTLAEWYSRCLGELEAMRAQAHQQVDTHFNEHARRLRVEVQMVEQDRDRIGSALN